MFFILEAANTMACLPRVHQHFRILRLIAHGAREPAVVLMRVGEHDATDVGDTNAGLAQTFMERVVGFFGFWTGVDQGYRIFRNQVDVDRTDVERRWERDGNDAHG